MNIDLFSEPFSKTGNIAADGFRRLLGCPAQNIIQTVLRESIQNSIDAARLGCGPLVLIRYRTLTLHQRDYLRGSVFREIPEDEKISNVLTASLEKEDLKVLEICDFNTTGLGGPTDGDAATDHGESHDFVNFIRNVGVARDAHHGGGTYGYGKTSLYVMSTCSTILIDSQTRFKNKPVRRFIGCHLGSAFNSMGRRFTGRHWWGTSNGDVGIDPLTDDDAAATAKLLGMPERGIDSTGTSIFIIDPNVEVDENGRLIENEILENILWNFWPRLTESTPENKKLSIFLEIEGEDIPIPKPELFPPFDLFSSAMAQYRRGENVNYINSLRPKRQLGSLAFSKGLRADRNGPALDDDSIIPHQLSHIALMRPVELVVKYVIGEPFHDDRFEWAGIFVCSNKDDEIEEAFALSEPPAHDDWVPDILTNRNAKIFVRNALKKIDEYAKNYANPVSIVNSSSGEKGPSLASTASRLGNFLDKVSSRGPGRNPPSVRTIPKRNNLFISLPRFIGLDIFNGDCPCAIFEATLQNDGKNCGLEVFAESYLVADGSVANGDNLPESFKTKVIDISLVTSGHSVYGERIKVGTESDTIRVRVLSPRDAAIGLRIIFSDKKDN